MVIESKRPKLHIPISKLEIILEIIAVIAIILTWGYLIISWSNIPSIIPTHFNTLGQANSYGSKDAIFITPIIGTIAFIALNILARFPHLFNYTVKITKENAERQYRNGRLIIEVLVAELSILFFYINYTIIEVALKKSSGLGIQFLPIFIIVFVGTLFFFISRMQKLK